MTKNYQRFISFEGIDYSGKSTQVKMLVKRLQRLGVEPVVLREPGGTRISERIRDILLDTAYFEMHEKCEILLYEAARAQLVHQKIIPLLESGRFVIADRFFDSSSAYQGFGRGLTLDEVKQLNRFATSALKPYRTFFIDISPQEAQRRQVANNRTRDRLESAGIEFFTKIRQGFLTLCEEEPGRFIKINGEGTPAEVAEKVWAKILKIWELHLNFDAAK